MATHYVEPGTVPIILGAIYSRYPANRNYTWCQARLTLINEGTGCGKLHYLHEGGQVFYVSLAELSRYWHLIRRV
jgi:hypothetical protein